jgi:hypothetical protein
MTIVIYFTEDKKNYQVIRPKTEGKDKFDGNVRLLVEHITHSDFNEGIRNYHSFQIF